MDLQPGVPAAAAALRLLLERHHHRGAPPRPPGDDATRRRPPAATPAAGRCRVAGAMVLIAAWNWKHHRVDADDLQPEQHVCKVKIWCAVQRAGEPCASCTWCGFSGLRRRLVWPCGWRRWGCRGLHVAGGPWHVACSFRRAPAHGHGLPYPLAACLGLSEHGSPAAPLGCLDLGYDHVPRPALHRIIPGLESSENKHVYWARIIRYLLF